MEYAIILAAVAVAYVIGSMPTGFIIVKLLKGIDIRTIYTLRIMYSVF